jgi:hypothetical protein
VDIESGLSPVDVAGGIWERLDGTQEEMPYRVRLNDLTALFAGMSNTPDLIGYVREDVPLEVGGYTISLDSVDEYTILQFVYDPGVPIVYFGGFLLIIGLTIALYMPWRTGRVILKQNGDRVAWIAGGNSSEFPEAMKSEMPGKDD